MYCNGVSVSDAAKLYKACQAVWRNFSETHVYGWYMQWDTCVPRNIFYSNMNKKCVMWLRRDERMEPEIIVRNFGPTRSHWPASISLRIEELRMVWGEIRGNMS